MLYRNHWIVKGLLGAGIETAKHRKDLAEIHATAARGYLHGSTG